MATGSMNNLSAGATKTLLAEYCYTEIKEIISSNGILVYEHFKPEQITKQYFKVTREILCPLFFYLILVTII